jgi:hypothetical protein
MPFSTASTHVFRLSMLVRLILAAIAAFHLRRFATMPFGQFTD